MDRRDCLKLLATSPLAMAAAKAEAAYGNASYARAIVIDGQGAMADPYSGPDDTQLSARAVAEMRQSGLTAVSVTVNDVGNGPDVWSTTIQTIGIVEQAISDNPNAILKAAGTADIRRAKSEGKIGLIFNLQDTSLIGTQLDRIATLKGLGVRIVQLTYNNRNLSGDGCLEPANAGLSKLGRATIARIEKERLLLDLSHAGQRTTAEGIAAATRPMAISHTGCRALNDNPRNQWDAELKACADKGGVVGIYWMPFLVANGRATGEALVAHMDHAVNVCGEDHVAIGTDNILFKTNIDDEERARQKAFYEQRSAAGIAAPGEGPDVFNIVWDWDGHMRFRKLADGLAAKGWSAARIDKVLGGNLMRLYAETWS
jgi:membrane dipeptidase